jgi:outer membrane biosynthesis protein TonB
VVSEKSQVDALKDIDADQIAKMSVLQGKDALAKYGEKGKNGAVEITSRKKAVELGIKFPFRRQNPEDYPTFRGESYLKFSNWLSGRIKYPDDAVAGKKEGRVTINFVIQPDGSLTVK